MDHPCILELLQGLSGIQLDEAAFTATVSSCGPHWKAAVNLFWWGRRCGLLAASPRSAVVGGCAQASAWEQSIAVLTGARPQPSRTALAGFSSAMAACDAARRWDWGLELLQFARQGALRVDVALLNAALSSAASAWTQASLALAALARDLQPDLITWNTLVACSEWSQALEASEEVRMHWRADVVTNTALLSACEQGLQWPAAVSLVSEGQDVNVQAFTAAASACHSAGHFERALAMIEQMQRKALLPDAAVFSTALLACERLGSFTRAQAVLELSTAQRQELDAVMCGAALGAASSAAEAALADQLQELGLRALEKGPSSSSSHDAMGAGSSVPPLPKEKSAAVFNAHSTSTVEAEATQTAVVKDVEGVQWLLTAVDKEKQEKAWLAKKFEEKCAEVQALHEELQRARALLERGPTLSSVTTPVSPSQEPSPASSRGTMAQRRGLQLSVQTGKKPEAPKVQVSEPAALLRAKSSPVLAGDKEPMSALLRRRKEDWTPVQAPVPAVPAVPEVQEVPDAQGLSVSTNKVFSLFHECPASPKRVKPATVAA
ncbi:unnamed protein product [Effrenium voratum]|uniref:Pentatricopeptide repeat-containing protein, chloroplastic n=1 Tax=Effrenium voratum TaxID=2562239 RepID=A0AA36MSI3_9DINO|nr:unnamed protein product [Effrenium voratum]